MKKNNSLIIFLLITFICLSGISYAIPSIEIKEIDIEENVYLGDVLDVAVDFAISSDRSELIRLSLYIDNKIKDSYSSFYPDGDFTFTFHYDTDYISGGEHSIRIKAEVIRDENVKDSDSQSQTFELKQLISNIYHDVTISQINYPLKAPMNSNIPITLTIENNGIVDESSMQTEVKMNAITYKSDYFYLKKGEKKIQTIYVKTPMNAGKFKIKIKTSNPYVMNEKTIDLVVEDISLLLKTDSVNIIKGKYIFIYGYVREESPRQNYVYIYKDNYYFTKIMPDKDGYFSHYLKFEKEGEHIISAKIYGMKKNIKINVYAPKQEQQIIIENKTTATSPECIENKTKKQEEFPKKTESISGYFVKISEKDNIIPLFLLFFALLLVLSYGLFKNHHVNAVPWNNINSCKEQDEGKLKPGKSIFSNIEGKKDFEKKSKKFYSFKEKEYFPSSHWVSYRNIIK